MTAPSAQETAPTPDVPAEQTDGFVLTLLTAAAFLQCFVNDLPWIHLDIAGTAYTESWARTPPYQPSSCATGVGVRLLLEFARRWSA